MFGVAHTPFQTLTLSREGDRINYDNAISGVGNSFIYTTKYPHSFKDDIDTIIFGHVFKTKSTGDKTVRFTYAGIYDSVNHKCKE